MTKRLIIIMVFLLGSLLPHEASNAYFSKNEFSKDKYIEWMYKNSKRNKEPKMVTKRKLGKIYDRIMVENFPNIKLALIKTESSFDNSVIGGSKERCLMQVSPVWVKDLKEKGIINNFSDLTTDFNKCITAGSYIFDHYYRKTGNIEKTIMLYNGGGDPDYRKKVLVTLGSMKIVQEEINSMYPDIKIKKGEINTEVIE